MRIPESSAPVASDLAVIAEILVKPDATATVRKAEGPGVLRLNGIAIDSEPAPLLHGDRLDIGECELRFATEALSADTLEFPALDVDPGEAVPSRTAPQSQVNGRLVSLADGREYPIRRLGLRIGRDASSDVVVTAPEVSRRHATVRVVQDGYTIFDTSFNGVFLNGRRVHIEVQLGRGDTLRVGPEEFRFYADPELDPDDASAPPQAAAELPTAPTDLAARDIRAVLAKNAARRGGPTRAMSSRPVRASRRPIGAFLAVVVLVFIAYLVFVFIGIGGF